MLSFASPLLIVVWYMAKHGLPRLASQAVWSSLIGGRARHNIGRFSAEKVYWIQLESWIMRLNLVAMITYSSYTTKISYASFIQSQLVSDNVNISHIICFVTWPLHQIVVIGLYQWSALATNKLMGYYSFSRWRMENRWNISIPDRVCSLHWAWDVLYFTRYSCEVVFWVGFEWDIRFVAFQMLQYTAQMSEFMES